jgi:hypothetical protein
MTANRTSAEALTKTRVLIDSNGLQSHPHSTDGRFRAFSCGTAVWNGSFPGASLHPLVQRGPPGLFQGGQNMRTFGFFQSEVVSIALSSYGGDT